MSAHAPGHSSPEDIVGDVVVDAVLAQGPAPRHHHPVTVEAARVLAAADGHVLEPGPRCWGREVTLQCIGHLVQEREVTLYSSVLVW